LFFNFSETSIDKARELLIVYGLVKLEALEYTSEFEIFLFTKNGHFISIIKFAFS